MMTEPVQAALELGPKGKRFVAYAPAWPGWSRGEKTEQDAIDTLEAYRERYRPVAERAGFGDEFVAAGELDVVERYVGTGSTDFWGISFAASPGEVGPMSEDVLERKLALLRACWAYFDEVLGRVTPELKKGPRGGGRDRDDILNHTYGTERTQMAVKVGVKTPEGVQLTAEGRNAPRELSRGDSRVQRRGEEGANLGTPVPVAAHRLSHDGPRLGNGRQDDGVSQVAGFELVSLTGLDWAPEAYTLVISRTQRPPNVDAAAM
jgi:hypothetical protein